jgi:hypothetical protein
MIKGQRNKQKAIGLSNMPVSVYCIREFDSNEIDGSDLHSLKHDEPRISTFRGISSD